jgi:hypothetical protein
MNPKKYNGPNMVYLKIGFYVLTFIVLIYVMRYAKSESFSNSLELFLGQPSQNQMLNWCPEEPQLVVWIPKDRFTAKPLALASLCKFSTQSYEISEVEKIHWRPMLMAKDKSGAETFLESDESFNFVRKGSLIFKTRSLRTLLETSFESK